VAYVRYLEMGGELAFDDLTPALLKSIIDRGHPILAGLSATYLYGFARERWDETRGRSSTTTSPATRPATSS
jgi:hypothetical protein